MPFSDETLFSRLLALEMQQLNEPMAEHIIQRKLKLHGPAIWADIMRKLNIIINALHDNPTVKPQTKSRLDDFNVFCARIESSTVVDGKTLNMGLLSMIDAQLKQLKESSQAITFLEEWISARPSEAAQWNTTTELFNVLSTMCQAHHMQFQWKTPLSLTRHLTTLKDRLIKDFGAEFASKSTGTREEISIKFRTVM
jgi:hypothetical protein